MNTQGGELYAWDRAATAQTPLFHIFLSADGMITIAGERFDTSAIEQLDAIGWKPSDDPLRPLPLEIFMRDYFEPRLEARLVGCLRSGGERCDPTVGARPDLASLNRVQPAVKSRLCRRARRRTGCWFA